MNEMNNGNNRPENGGGFQNPYYQSINSRTTDTPGATSWTDSFTGDRFLKGLLIGAAATYLLTNEKAQKVIMKTGMKLFSTVAGGVEEMKEKILDAKAEAEAEAAKK